MDQPLIFDRVPKLKQNIPWLPLGTFPTPVERLCNLETARGLDNIWIKRDDLAGDIYGGNKVRTLEYSLADAVAKQSQRIFAYSALGSNWPLACVIYSAMKKIPTDVFFLPFPMDSIKEENLKLTKELANRVVAAKRLITFPFLFFFNVMMARRHFQTYVMPPGGVSPVTTLGFVNAILELKEQCERGEMPRPDYIFCPLGSGGTAAGMAIGLHLVGWPTKVVAVRIVDFIVANRLVLGRLIRKTVAVLRRNAAPVNAWGSWTDNLIIEHNHFGKGYGVATRASEEGTEMMRNLESHLLDATYTAKTFAAMLDLAPKDEYRGKVLLFWHTLNSRPLQGLANRLARDST